MRASTLSVALVGLTATIAFLISVFGPPNLAFRPDADVSPRCTGHSVLKRKAPGAELVNRLWVDKKAANARDLTFHLMLVEKAKQRVGAAAHTSAWRFHVDRLRFSLDGAKLTLESPQDGTKATFKTRTFPCKGKAPAPFDLCLELKHGRRTVTLYSEKASHFGAEGELGLFGAALQSADVPACADCVEALPEWFEARATEAAAE